MDVWHALGWLGLILGDTELIWGDFELIWCDSKLIWNGFELIWNNFELIWNYVKWYEIDVKEDANDDGHYWDMIKLAKKLELVEW